MSLEYVARGEGIKASTVNSLIDAVQGRGDMSPDLIVTGTRSGPQLVAPTQLGSGQLPQQCMFDVKNYTLSGWPMTQIQLGFALSDALEGVRVHKEEGIVTAVSAVVVHNNSSNCPVAGGQLSGYLLQESDFPSLSSVSGRSGWIRTKIEGVYGDTCPSLQVWETTSSVIEVFTNADESSTQSQVSSILTGAGMPASEFSDMKKLSEWKLVYQTQYQNTGRSIPTARTQMMHGVVDIYSVTATADNKFHFKWGTELSGETKYGKVGEGAVQIGGYSYFSDGGRVNNCTSADNWVCVNVDLVSPPSMSFVAYDSISALNYAQGDHSKYVFPLYKVRNWAVVVDYRPMPNSGGWELAEGATVNG